MAKAGPRTILAQSAVGTVEQCSAGAVQLTVGFVTLHLAPGALTTLAATLNTAVQQKRAQERAAVQDMCLLLGEPVGHTGGGRLD